MLEVISKRRSVRKYTDRPVSDETIRELIESARLAPSGGHSQPWHFIVIRDSAIKERVIQACGSQSWMMNAPVLIACVADTRARIREYQELKVDEFSPEKELKLVLRDTAIAVEHLVLEAVNQGLGSCWVALFKQDVIRPVLGVPADKYVVSVMTIGYPAETPAPKSRKSFDDIFHLEQW